MKHVIIANGIVNGIYSAPNILLYVMRRWGIFWFALFLKSSLKTQTLYAIQSLCLFVSICYVIFMTKKKKTILLLLAERQIILATLKNKNWNNILIR